MAKAPQNRFDANWLELEQEYINALRVMQEAKDAVDLAKKKLIEEFEDGIDTNVGELVTLARTVRKGSISYTTAIKELKLDPYMFEDFRGESSEVWVAKER